MDHGPAKLQIALSRSCDNPYPSAHAHQDRCMLAYLAPWTNEVKEKRASVDTANKKYQGGYSTSTEDSSMTTLQRNGVIKGFTMMILRLLLRLVPLTFSHCLCLLWVKWNLTCQVSYLNAYK